MADQHAESVAIRTYIIEIEVEVVIPASQVTLDNEESMLDKAYWSLRHVEFGGDIASIQITDWLDSGTHIDG